MTTLKEKAQKLIVDYNTKRHKLLKPYYESIPGKIDKIVLDSAVIGYNSAHYYVISDNDLNKKEFEKSIKIAKAYIIQEKLTYEIISLCDNDNTKAIKISW